MSTQEPEQIDAAREVQRLRAQLKAYEVAMDYIVTPEGRMWISLERHLDLISKLFVHYTSKTDIPTTNEPKT